MKTCILILSITIIILLFAGCNKDKPTKSKIAGLWRIEEYTTNAIDSLSLFDSTTYKRYVDIIAYERGDDFDANFFNIANMEGIWELVKDPPKLIINNQRVYYNSNFVFGPFKDGITVEWDIKELEDKSMWLETNYENKNYSLKLSSISKQFD